jgi:hypothetical protein
MKTLGQEIGVGERQAQKLVAELEGKGLIRRISRFVKGAQTSNAFEFLWHEVLEGANDSSGGRVNDSSGEGVNPGSPKESQDEESQDEESQNIDLDSPTRNRKKRDSRREVGDVRGRTEFYPQLSEALANYMTTADDKDRIFPSERQVADVMDAAAGASVEDVLQCLHYLRYERRLGPGTKHGPRYFAWFKTVVGDYFQQKSNREVVFAMPHRADQRGSRLPNSEFEFLTDAIEIPK